MDTQSDPLRRAKWQTYITAFVITALIFGTALATSSYFENRRLSDIRSTQDSISVDILSLETQFDLLEEHSCTDIGENSVLSYDLAPLGERLSYMENQSSVSQKDIAQLKSYYSLLEIKDLLLMKKVSSKCNLEPIFVLYFYSNAGDCKDCKEQGFVLTTLARQYPQLRIYSFDYNLDLSALRTLISINQIGPDLPALIVNDHVYSGFQSIDDIREILPELSSLEESTTAEEN